VSVEKGEKHIVESWGIKQIEGVEQGSAGPAPTTCLSLSRRRKIERWGKRPLLIKCAGAAKDDALLERTASTGLKPFYTFRREGGNLVATKEGRTLFETLNTGGLSVPEKRRGGVASTREEEMDRGRKKKGSNLTIRGQKKREC